MSQFGFPSGAVNASEIQGVPISSTTPTDGQVLKYVDADGKWEPGTGGGGAGTVTSVGIGTGLSSTQTPLTTTGTLSVTEPLPAHTSAGKVIYDTGSAYAETAAGTIHQVLHGAAGVPTWGQIDLATEVTGTLLIANGGTGAITQNFVDLSNPQTVGGVKTFTSLPVSSGMTGTSGAQYVLTTDQADGPTPSFILNNSVLKTGFNPLLQLQNVGRPCMDVVINGQSVGLEFYNPGTGAFTASFQVNGATRQWTIYNFLAIAPFTDKLTTFGGAGLSKWASIGSYQYEGVEQSPTGTGAVTITVANGESTHLLASGNISSITLSNGLPGEQIVLTMVQDATGLLTWPTAIANAKLPGGVFAKTLAANAIDVMSLAWDATFGKWLQTSYITNLS